MHQPPQLDDTSFIALPTSAHVIRCLRAGATIGCLFLFVYSATDFLTGLYSQHVRIDFPFEQRLPFIPELTLVYSSLYLMFLTIPFVMRTQKELSVVIDAYVVVTVVAGLCFLLLPAETGFEVPTDLGRFPAAFRIADKLNQTYNLCPSLHVAYGVTCAELFRLKNVRYGSLFHFWAFAIAIAAWLTYQHHLLDLMAGYGVAMTTVFFISQRHQRR